MFFFFFLVWIVYFFLNKNWEENLIMFIIVEIPLKIFYYSDKSFAAS